MKKEGPLKLVIIMILGIFLLFFVVDFGLKLYSNVKVKNDALDALNIALTDAEDTSYLESTLEKTLKEKGYTKDNYKILYKDNKLYLVLHRKYFSIIKSLISKDDTINTVRYNAYYNEYKEVVIEQVNDETID